MSHQISREEWNRRRVEARELERIRRKNTQDHRPGWGGSGVAGYVRYCPLPPNFSSPRRTTQTKDNR